MSVNRRWLWPAAAVLLMLGLAACGTKTPAGAGTSASVNLSLNTVPIVRSITVSPSKDTFGGCTGGHAAANTASTPNRLGYPNGRCWVGKQNPGGSFPITITNTGIASQIDVSGASATPSDNGTGWSLCNRGSGPVVRCTGSHRNLPGTDQYLVEIFSPDNRETSSGISDNPSCDHQFSHNGGCYAVQNQSQTEGFELIGPAKATDTQSTNWTVTITWTPVPR